MYSKKDREMRASDKCCKKTGRMVFLHLLSGPSNSCSWSNNCRSWVYESYLQINIEGANSTNNTVSVFSVTGGINMFGHFRTCYSCITSIAKKPPQILFHEDPWYTPITLYAALRVHGSFWSLSPPIPRLHNAGSASS